MWSPPTSQKFSNIYLFIFLLLVIYISVVAHSTCAGQITCFVWCAFSRVFIFVFDFILFFSIFRLLFSPFRFAHSLTTLTTLYEHPFSIGTFSRVHFPSISLCAASSRLAATARVRCVRVCCSTFSMYFFLLFYSVVSCSNLLNISNLVSLRKIYPIFFPLISFGGERVEC